MLYTHLACCFLTQGSNLLGVLLLCVLRCSAYLCFPTYCHFNPYFILFHQILIHPLLENFFCYIFLIVLAFRFSIQHFNVGNLRPQAYTNLYLMAFLSSLCSLSNTSTSSQLSSPCCIAVTSYLIYSYPLISQVKVVHRLWLRFAHASVIRIDVLLDTYLTGGIRKYRASV